MQNFSLTIRGWIVVVLIEAFQWADIDISEADILTGIHFIASLLALGAVYAGRLRRGDITWYGRRIS